MTTVKINSILGDLSKFELDIVFPLIRFFNDDDLDYKMGPWLDYEIGNGEKFPDKYIMIGSDIGGDRIIINKEFTGPVYMFNHESDDFKITQLADTLNGFLATCREIRDSKSLDIKLVGTEKFIKEYNRIRDVVSKYNDGNIPEFWSNPVIDGIGGNWAW